MIEIERDEPIEPFSCACCGGVTRRFTRFVHRDGNAHAVYCASFVDAHAEEGVQAIISLGGWGEDEVPPERVAFAVRFQSDAGGYGVMVGDAEKSPWGKVEIFGRKLTREEALTHEWLAEVFRLTDEIIERDEEVRQVIDLTCA